MSRAFPPGFLWGASTSAYQIEGSPLADGAGASIWHRFAHTPGRTLDDQNADVACDHYRRWAGDVALMKSLGLQSYRFSIAWGRVLPGGRGRVNRAGLDFYSRLVDALLEAGIQPMATLYHWDLPAALDDQGGWLNRDIANWFGDYADVCFEALGDRVPRWCTINEPWVIVDGGYLHGVNAPGHANRYEAPIAAHNVLRAHGEGVRRHRARGAKSEIGLVVNLAPHHPATDRPEDAEAAARANAYFNEQYLDPVYRGAYSEAHVRLFGDAFPEFPAADFDLIRTPFDYLGINWYTRNFVVHDPRREPAHSRIVERPNLTTMTTGWQVQPDGLTETLAWVTGRYGRMPIHVTENGAAFYDPPSPVNGRVEDPLREEYLRLHIAAVRDAMDRGVDVRGYFVWSLMDNFEWHSGFTKRFGLLHVDYATLERTVKRSGEFYREVIRTNGANAVG